MTHIHSIHHCPFLYLYNTKHRYTIHNSILQYTQAKQQYTLSISRRLPPTVTNNKWMNNMQFVCNKKIGLGNCHYRALFATGPARPLKTSTKTQRNQNGGGGHKRNKVMITGMTVHHTCACDSRFSIRSCAVLYPSVHVFTVVNTGLQYGFVVVAVV